MKIVKAIYFQRRRARGAMLIYMTATMAVLCGMVSLAGNLTINMVRNPNNNQAPGLMTISGGTALYATVYAPLSGVKLTGSGDIYGSVVGKTIDMTGSSEIHYDLALPGGSATVSLVK